MSKQNPTEIVLAAGDWHPTSADAIMQHELSSSLFTLPDTYNGEDVFEHSLAGLVQRFGSSIETLREIAFEHCGIPRDAQVGLVDLWLYERLAMASSTMGWHFGVNDKEQVISSIEHGMLFCEGSTFAEKCFTSWADVVANPIVRHEILLWDRRLLRLHSDSQFRPHTGAENEAFSDILGLVGLLEAGDRNK